MYVGTWVVALLLSAVFLGASCQKHKCIHDELVETHRRSFADRHTVAPQNYGLHERSLRTALTYANIRIILDYSFFGPQDPLTCYEGGPAQVAIGTPAGNTQCSTAVTNNCFMQCQSQYYYTTAKGAYIQGMMAKAMAYFQQTLLVVPVVGNLTLTGSQFCGFNGGVTVPSSPYFTTGVPADMIMFVTARPTTSSVIAYAGSCTYDDRGRPLLGQINFGPNQASMAAADYDEYLGVAIHESSHALGFQGSRFGYFVSDYAANTKYAAGTITTSVTYADGSTRSLVTTPRVVAATRAHYGCSTLQGAELEDSGGSGTSGSHWEKRSFADEYMTGSSSPNPYYSAITLSLFEDSGWYTVNYSQAVRFDFGRNQGCAFVTGNCAKWSGRGFQCQTANSPSCTYNGQAKGYCDIEIYDTNIQPVWYQHFSNPMEGGYDDLADMCPLVRAWENGACNDPATGTAESPSYGEAFLGDSLCYDSTAAWGSPSLSAQLTGDGGSGGGTRQSCYRSFCLTSAGPLYVQLGGIEWLPCTSTGQVLTFAGYSGQVTCPDPVWFCDKQPNVTTSTFVSITPSSVSAGTAVEITATNLGLVSSITVGFHPCTNLVVGNTTASCIVAAHPELDASTTASVCLLNSKGYGTCGTNVVTVDVQSSFANQAAALASAALIALRAFFVVNWWWAIPLFLALLDILVYMCCRRTVNKQMMKVAPADYDQGGEVRQRAKLNNYVD